MGNFINLATRSVHPCNPSTLIIADGCCIAGRCIFRPQAVPVKAVFDVNVIAAVVVCDDDAVNP